MMLYISVRDHARKLKFQQLCSSAIYKQNVSLSLLLSDSVRCRRGYYFSALAPTWMLLLSIYVLLECINKIYKYGHAWVI